MKSILADWFVVKIRYDKTQENGLQKKVTEQYAIDSLSFAEAEKRICEEMSAYVIGDIEVMDISRAPFGEVFFIEGYAAGKWYKTCISFITINENTGKEKRITQTYLVQATDLEAARKNIDEAMRGSMLDYVITAVNESRILDVFILIDKEVEGNENAKLR